MSGKCYPSFEAAVRAGQAGKAFPEGGCAFSSPCRRAGVSGAEDYYEPNEWVLRDDGIPDLFYCDPENLLPEAQREYFTMADELWSAPSETNGPSDS